MLRALIAAVAAVGLWTVAAADEPAKKPAQSLQELDSRLDAILKTGNVPGAQIVYVEDNKVIWRKNYGFADRAAQKPVTAQTLFRAGSITKTFTSLLALSLVAEGKLDLNAKVADLAPDIGFDNPWEATAPLRFVNLLEHTSGWRDLAFADLAPIAHADSVDGWLASTRRLRTSRWQPGRYMAYSNIGVGAAGAILQRIGGADYAALVRDRVLQPMGITGASFALSDENRATLSKSYDTDGTTEIPYHGIGLAAAGSMLITADELAKLVIFMNTRGVTETGKPVVSAAAIARMEDPASTLAAGAGLKLGYGLGVFYAPQDNFTVHGHNGGIDGFETAYVYWPETKRGYVAMINGGTANEAMLEEITLYLGRGYQPRLPPEVQVDRPAFAPYVGWYVPIALRHPFLNALLQLVPQQVSIGDTGQVIALGSERIGAGNMLFRRAERADPNMVFYATPEGDRDLSTGTSALRQLTMVELIWHAALIAAVVIAAAWSILLLLVRFVRLFIRRSPQPSTGILGAGLRWLPLLSLAAFAAMLGIFFVSANTGAKAVEILGTQSSQALSIYYLSLVAPALALLGLLAALFAPNGNGRLSRAAALTISTAMLGLSAYLYAQGWIGVQFWT